MITVNCPECGEEFELEEAGECPFCGTYITEEDINGETGFFEDSDEM